MKEDVRQLLLPVTGYWSLQHLDGYCQTPETAIPWLLSLIAICVCYSIFLGASDVRRFIRKTLGNPLHDDPIQNHNIVTLAGSFILYLAMTLATAQLLRSPSMKGPTESKIGYGTALGAWMVRPLPGFMVSITSVMSRSTYRTNAMELQQVETLLGQGAGYVYIDILKKSQRTLMTLQSSNSTPTFTGSTSSVSTSVAPTATVILGDLQVSLDGTCGGENKYTCLGTVDGDCCSSSGYCGSDSDYCTSGAGCRPAFGKCTPEMKEKRHTASSDGSCGMGSGYTCSGSRWGNCCSASSYCGSEDAFCGEGCQLEYGDCWNPAGGGSDELAAFEKEIVRLLGGLRGAAILGVLVFAASLLTPALSKITSSKKKSIIVGCFLILSLGRFVAGVLLWMFALRLDPGAFCVDRKTISAVTIVWALVPFADHLWRASFGP